MRRALISVSDKSGLIPLALLLHDRGAEILSTGGTASHLREAGIPVRDVSDYTGAPEILDGRVKTLHPKIHGGLLGIRSKDAHRAQMKEQGIEPIDMIVVNLYPFREVAAREGSTFEEVIEYIDIGGPSMVRSAAKNHAYVAVVTDPRDYGWVMKELEANNCSLGPASRFILAQKAFAATASYDAAIAAWLTDRSWSTDGPARAGGATPRLEVLALEKVQDLRYGENPHQRAAFY
ncbi:MAG: bifunctional phosphoribosylaminoimidazolecarboxamide formyltransferase/IMP cyclohydrolase, partial [Acidobacteria bacterium]|nr:bifunctional phosphoribosylaminoimidazolecarboxamide formyltransferase/IMP cyclohydrolase [Acidobacteriota bacterium]